MPEDAYSVPVAATIEESQDSPVVPSQPLPAPPPTCSVTLPDGCYRLLYKPNLAGRTFRGTMRVDRTEGPIVISGDLYLFPITFDQPNLSPLAEPPLFIDDSTRPQHLDIPIYPRGRYHSYLKATAVQLVSPGPPPCWATITFQQYDYTPPPSGSFNGSFPPSPGSRTVTVRFRKRTAPSPLWPGAYYEGEWIEGGVSKGRVELGWVSTSFRKCTVEIDTLVDAVSPQPVPALGAPGTESFQTMLTSAGWQATVIDDQTAIPRPATVPDHKDCWTDANLHALMQHVRKPGTDLDAEWRMHLLVVPGKMACSRGKMYDSIDVPREGVVSYSDDGYPTSDSAFFGAAANKTQRQVPRAFLRSASHEVVHGFNQIHQEQEGGADNSIMTTTPSVANVLGTATTGDPGVFPDDIRLKVNTRVRHHMVHFPDPVVRPGGHTFASWAITPVPSADRWEIGPEYLALSVTAASDRVELGEPVQLSWTLTNTSARSASVPSEVTSESTYARITVIDATGQRRAVSPFVIECERSQIAPLAPGASLEASTRVYWSTNGFAFERPGRHVIEVSVDWTVGGAPMSVRSELPVFVNYPVTASDNEAAANLLHPDVGKWVALGGGAYHLTEAVNRLTATLASASLRADEITSDEVPEVKALRGYAGMLP